MVTLKFLANLTHDQACFFKLKFNESLFFEMISFCLKGLQTNNYKLVNPSAVFFMNLVIHKPLIGDIDLYTEIIKAILKYAEIELKTKPEILQEDPVDRKIDQDVFIQALRTTIRIIYWRHGVISQNKSALNSLIPQLTTCKNKQIKALSDDLQKIIA